MKKTANTFPGAINLDTFPTYQRALALAAKNLALTLQAFKRRKTKGPARWKKNMGQNVRNFQP